MKKKGDKFRKVLKSRALWGMICFVLCMWFYAVVGCGIHNLKQFYLMYYNGNSFWQIIIITAVAIYVARIEKDFFRGLKIAFSRQMGVSRMDLQRAVNAMEYTEKSIILATVLSLVFPLTDVFYHMDNMAVIGPVFGILNLSILYPTVLLLILYPVKARLEQMAISYMEEPEDSEEEQKEAEGQRLYFRLRGLGLTDRETEVARLAASGMNNVEIGRELYISTATVKKHMTHILEKMQCADREALAERVRGL